MKQHVESAELDKSDTDSAVFILPADESPKFPDMFQAVELAKDQLGISSFGLSLTTMEDVFLKIGEMTEEIGKENGGPPVETDRVSWKAGSNIDLEQRSEDSLVPELLSGWSLVLSQLVGLLVKRMTYTWRRKVLYTVMILIPVVMAVLTVVSINP